MAMHESRWRLSLQAAWWRALEKAGTWIHDIPAPRPKLPQFTRRFTPSNVGGSKDGVVDLHFYVRDDYCGRMKGEKFPVIINFHGGGFTLGTATDDGRWGRYFLVVLSVLHHFLPQCHFPGDLWTREEPRCGFDAYCRRRNALTFKYFTASMILQNVRAVFVSVEYRLAPEHPFPTAVEDGLEALLYLARNQEEFGIDAKQLILSGFSAGGNMTFSVPLKLQAYFQSLNTASLHLKAPKFNPNNLPRIVGIVSFYPILDFTISRDQKRAASVRPKKCLPKVFTNLFDAAYLSKDDDKLSPYLSPSLASNEMLAEALPDSIALYLCEWDMLLLEGKEFAERLQRLEKRVDCTIIAEEKHAFDKVPALPLNPKINVYYREACININRMLARDSRDTNLVSVRNQDFRAIR